MAVEYRQPPLEEVVDQPGEIKPLDIDLSSAFCDSPKRQKFINVAKYMVRAYRTSQLPENTLQSYLGGPAGKFLQRPSDRLGGLSPFDVIQSQVDKEIEEMLARRKSGSEAPTAKKKKKRGDPNSVDWLNHENW